MTINLCSLWDWNYHVKGLALIASLQRHVPDFHLWVLALDDRVWDYFTRHALDGVTVQSFDSFADAHVLAAKAERTHQEFCWTLEAVWTHRVMERHHPAHLAYIDADCYVFADLAPLYAEVQKADIAIIPHRWTPKYAARLCVNGTYNVSWVYFRQSDKGLACLKEWSELCLAWCYARNEGGKFADQGYWNELVPKYGAHAVRQLGANLAPWNAERYEYALSDDGDPTKVFVIEYEHGNIDRIDPLLFYHAHEWKSPQRRTNYPVPPFVAHYIYEPYETELGRIADGVK